MNDKVSVIVPIYNVEKYLKKCIDSILNQKYQNFEIILIDDCSTDNSLKIAEKYAIDYFERISLLIHNENRGLAATRNTGLKSATGKWITFIDSDDWIDYNYLKVMIEIAENDNADIVACSYYHAWDSGRTAEINPFGSLSTHSSQEEKVALMRNHACMRLYRKQFLDIHQLTFPENIARAEDMGFTIPLMTRTKRISIVNKPLYYYYQRVNSISNNNKSLDTSFYKLAFDELVKNCKPGFEMEIEYRAINEFMYGLTMLMIKAKKSNHEIKEHIKVFNYKYPTWKENSYFGRLSKSKRIFIWITKHKMISISRILVFLYNYIQARNNIKFSR